MTQWCYGLKCLGLASGCRPTDDTMMCRRRDTKSSDSTVVSCRPASILLADKREWRADAKPPKVHVIAEMYGYKYSCFIPSRDPGDERTVAFGASENYRRIGYLRSPVSVEMRD